MKQPVKHAELGVDGNCGFALLGENLQEGEVEFEPVREFYHDVINPQTGEMVRERVSKERCENIASRIAFSRLRARLDSSHEWLTYWIGPSHPKSC